MNKIIQSEIPKQNILFFDMDGTLVDTNYANYLAYQKAIKITIGNNKNLKFNHNYRFDKSYLVRFYPNITEQEYKSIISLKGVFYDEFLGETKLNDIVADFLLRSSRFNKTILVTKSNKNRALSTLRYHNLIEYFNDFLFAENIKVSSNKYESAINELMINPNNITVIEDDIIEISNAKKSGVIKKNIIHV